MSLFPLLLAEEAGEEYGGRVPPGTQPSSAEDACVRSFPGITRLEGIAATGDRFLCAVDDEERIHLLLTHP